jgi:hypothetical protein
MGKDTTTQRSIQKPHSFSLNIPDEIILNILERCDTWGVHAFLTVFPYYKSKLTNSSLNLAHSGKIYKISISLFNNSEYTLKSLIKHNIAALSCIYLENISLLLKFIYGANNSALALSDGIFASLQSRFFFNKRLTVDYIYNEIKNASHPQQYFLYLHFLDKINKKERTSSNLPAEANHDNAHQQHLRISYNESNRIKQAVFVILLLITTSPIAIYFLVKAAKKTTDHDTVSSLYLGLAILVGLTLCLLMASSNALERARYNSLNILNPDQQIRKANNLLNFSQNKFAFLSNNALVDEEEGNVNERMPLLA